MSTTYWEQLKDPRWQQKRLEILNRDGWRCQECGDTKHTLHVHHRRYERGKAPWEVGNEHLVVLCESCHAQVTELTWEARDFLAHLDLNTLKRAIDLLGSLDTGPSRHRAFGLISKNGGFQPSDEEWARMTESERNPF